MAVKKKYQKKKNAAPVAENSKPVISEKKINTPSKIFLGSIIAVFSFLLYANTLGHDYTVDDVTVITSNKIVQKGFNGIGEIFSTPYRKGYWERNENMYRPLSLVMFAIEWQLVPKQPWLGHLINVLLYAVTGFLIFYLLSALLKNQPYYLVISFVSALLFAAHPVHTEVVANIKSRDEILVLLFSVTALFCFVKFFDIKNNVWLVLSLFFYTFALFSKENAITFLAIFPFAIYFFRNITLKRNLLFSSLFLIPVAIYFAVRYSVLNHLGTHEQVLLINNSLAGASDFISRFSTAVLILGKYLLLLVFPHPLSSDYSYNQVPLAAFADPFALISGIVLAFFIFVFIRGLKPKSIYSFNIIYFFATISIVSNVFFLIEATMGERFLYMPSLGFCFAAGYFLVSAFSKEEKNIAAFALNKKLLLVLCIIIILFSFKTITRNADWKNNLTLLEKDIKIASKSAREHYAIGSALFVERAMTEKNEQLKLNILERSVFHLEKAIAIWPAYADAYNMLGKVYVEKKMPQKAIRSFLLAGANKNFRDAAFYLDFALAYGNAGDAVNAVIQLEKALTYEPNSPEAYSNLGMYYTDLKQFDNAISALRKAINLKPGFSKAYYNLGLAYAMSGQFENAVEPFQQSIQFNPDYTDAYNNLGNTYSALGNYTEALKAYEKVLQQEPGHAKALQNIGITYKILGDEERSAFYMNKAAAIQ